MFNLLSLSIRQGASDVSCISKRCFSLTSLLERRKPPKEEYENNAMRTRKLTADPFDR